MHALLLLFLILLHLKGWSQALLYKNAEFSGPVFTFKYHNQNLYVGAGSALECYLPLQNQNYAYLSKAHSNDVITGISVCDNYIYANNNGLGIAIFKNDNNNIVFKKIIWDSIIPGHSPAIVLNSNFVAFGLGSYGIILADVTDKENPQIVQQIKFPDFLLSIKRYQNLLFASDRTHGIFVFNVSNNILTPIDTFKVNGINYWYYCYVDSIAQKLYVYGHKNLLPVADTVTIAQFSLAPFNPDSCLRLCRFFSRPCVSLSVTNNIALASCWENGTYAIDFSGMPNILYQIPTSSYAIWNDIFYDSIAGVACLNQGLKIYKINVNGYTEVSTIDNFFTDVKGVALKDSFVYTALIDKGLGIAHIYNDSLYKLNIVPVNQIKNVYAKNNFLYALCDNYGTKVFSLQNPQVPQLISSLVKPFNNGALSAIQNENYLFVIDCYYSFFSRPVVLSVWDISNINAPQMVTELLLTTQNFPYDRPQVFLDINYPYLAISCFNDALTGSIHIIDISNSQNPYVICSLNNIYPGQIKLYRLGNQMFVLVANGSSANGVQNGLRIYELQNNSLNLVSSFVTGTSGNRTIGLDLINNYIVLAQGGLAAYGKIILLDIQNISLPQLVAETIIGSNTNHSDVRVVGQYIVHSSGSPGLMLLKTDINTSVEDVVYFDITENQYNLFSELEVFDLQGRKVAMVKSQSNGSLHFLRSGIYFLKSGNKVYKVIKLNE